MGLIVFIGCVTVIALVGVLIAYLIQRDQLFPPYQEPVAKEDIKATWPFPHGRP